jgi:hypothetical protein
MTRQVKKYNAQQMSIDHISKVRQYKSRESIAEEKM